MIDQLQAAKSGYFFAKVKPLTAKAMKELFCVVRAAQTAPSNNHFCCHRQTLDKAVFSAICFTFDRKPPFLDDSTNVVEKVCGYLLVVEYDNFVAVFKSQLDLPARFVKDYLSRIEPTLIGASVTHADSVFERLRLRNMTVSKSALRSKILEAENLDNMVGLASSSRFAPLGYSVKTNGEYYSATPSTGRIAQRSDRSDHQALVNYACQVIDGMKTSGSAGSAFLDRFARPLNLSSLTASPTVLAVDVTSLRVSIFDDEEVRLVKMESGKWVSLTRLEMDAICLQLETAFGVHGKSPHLEIVALDGVTKVGSITVNKNRIALKSLLVLGTTDIYVERFGEPLGLDSERKSLRRFLDERNAFLVLFSDPQLAYIDGTLYRDEALTNGGAEFVRYLFEESTLNSVSAEKGAFVSGQTTFDAESTFGVIVNAAAKEDDLLVCDDLGDEWADFIGVRSDPAAPRITFYHAKHGQKSLGASPFHVSVSQAIKNLGRFALQQSAMDAKFRGWRETYNNANVRTSIQRVCRGDSSTLEAQFNACRGAPYAIKRVAIVTSSLSKIEVVEALKNMQAGLRPSPYFVQLYWLLSSFFSACSEVGADGCVICQP